MASAPAWVVDSTVAGTGRRGFKDGTADQATFHRPCGVCVARDGSLLVADTGNHAIRRVAPARGRPGLHVTTVMGDGKPGFTDGDHLRGRLHAPTALLLDASGTVFVADTGNHSVRALHPPAHDMGSLAWTLTTVAGGPVPGFSDGEAGEALFRRPASLAMSATGELLVADAGNHTVRCLRARPSMATLRRLRDHDGGASVATAGADGGRHHDTAGGSVDDPDGDGDGGTVMSGATGARASFVDSVTGRHVVPLGAGTRRGPAVVAAFEHGSAAMATPGHYQPHAAATGGVAPEYAAPGDIAMLHRRFAHVVTVAGPPAPDAYDAGHTHDPRAMARFADGFHSRARFRCPTGLCRLPGGLGAVAVTDSHNSFVRLLVPRRVVFDPPPGLASHFPRTLLDVVAAHASQDTCPAPRRIRQRGGGGDGGDDNDNGDGGDNDNDDGDDDGSRSPRVRSPAKRFAQGVHCGHAVHARGTSRSQPQRSNAADATSSTGTGSGTGSGGPVPRVHRVRPVHVTLSPSRHSRPAVLDATPAVGAAAARRRHHRHLQPTAASRQRARATGVVIPPNACATPAAPSLAGVHVEYDGAAVTVGPASPPLSRYTAAGGVRPFAGWLTPHGAAADGSAPPSPARSRHRRSASPRAGMNTSAATARPLSPAPPSSRVPWADAPTGRRHASPPPPPPTESLSYDLVRMHHPSFARSERRRRRDRRGAPHPTGRTGRTPPATAATSADGRHTQPARRWGPRNGSGRGGGSTGGSRRGDFSPGPILAQVVAAHAAAEPSPLSPSSTIRQPTHQPPRSRADPLPAPVSPPVPAPWRQRQLSMGPWHGTTTGTAVRRPTQPLEVPLHTTQDGVSTRPPPAFAFHPVASRPDDSSNALVTPPPLSSSDGFRSAIMSAMAEMEEQMKLTEAQLKEHRAARHAALGVEPRG